MGGDISIESQLGQGSEFTIRVPVQVQEVYQIENANEQQNNSVQIAPQENRSLDKREVTEVNDRRTKVSTILVIDNDLSVADLLERSLGGDGFTIEVVCGGKAGVERAVELIPDLILLEVVLPDVGGWSVLSQIKDNPLLVHIPVVMHSMIDERSTAATLGAADYLVKPVDREALSKCVKRNLRVQKGPRMLVVDDDADIRRMTRMVFENEGWNVVEGTDGEVALMRVAEKPPTAIVLDLNMPRLDGFGFLKKLRENPEWKAIPVLVLAMGDISDDERNELLASADMVIDKGPYSLDTLLRRLRELVGPKREELHSVQETI
jgi:DNA-binding response OmpR family regulator